MFPSGRYINPTSAAQYITEFNKIPKLVGHPVLLKNVSPSKLFTKDANDGLDIR